MSDGTAVVSTTGNRYSARAFELFADATDELEELLSHSKADRTLRGYASDWRQLYLWARTKGLEIPPVDGGVVDLGGEPIPPALLMLWIADSQGEVKASTVTRRMAAVRHFHHQAGLSSPTDHPKVREVVAGFTRKHRSQPTQAEPISGPELVAMVEGLSSPPWRNNSKTVGSRSPAKISTAAETARSYLSGTSGPSDDPNS